MSLRALTCPNCGAPRPSSAAGACAYCGATLVEGGGGRVAAADFLGALAGRGVGGDEAGVVWVGGVPYRLRGRIARGEGSDVFLADRARPPAERVIIKVLRAPDDGGLLAREWAALASLRESGAPGAAHFVGRFPSPVARGEARAGGRSPRPASVFRHASGFVHTLDDVARAHPGGVDARAAAWLWRRLLEALGFAHASGWAHGAVLPQHVLVHARDHGAMLVGWSCATRLGSGERLPAVAAGRLAFYTERLAAFAPPTPEDDIAMSARCVAHALGGYACAPEPLAGLLREHAAPSGRPPRGADAWALDRRVAEAARRAFGPSAYHPFAMPGWR